MNKKQKKIEKKRWLEQQAFNAHIEKTDVFKCLKHDKENCIDCFKKLIKLIIKKHE